MSYLLDTNICIFAIKGNQAVIDRLEEQDPNDLGVSTITLAELWFGAQKSVHPKRVRALQDAFLGPLTVLDFSRESAEHYSEIRLFLERQGTPIGERDQLIAATARAVDRTLVTNNRREFERIRGLKVVDWTAP